MSNRTRARRTDKQNYAQACREQLANLPLVDQLVKVLTCLSIGHVPEYATPSRNTTVRQIAADQADPDSFNGSGLLCVVEWRPMTAEDVKRYSQLLRTIESTLRKLVPDLKSVEVTDNTSRETLTDAELAQRITGILSAAGKEDALKSKMPPWLN